MTAPTKAERTRTRIQSVALELFTARGYDTVTVEEVAAAAGVSHMTFYRHFPTKESVVLDDPFDPLIAEAIATTDPTAHPLTRVVVGIRSVLELMDDDHDEPILQRVSLAVENPNLRARIWENNNATHRLISDRLVDDGTPRRDADVAAGAVLGALTAALVGWAGDGGPEPLRDRLGAAMDVIT